MKMLKTTFALLLLLSAQFMSAQMATIRGSVVDKETNDVLIGAAIKLTNGSYIIKGTVSDLDGKFVFQATPGEYSITAEYTGYQAFKLEKIHVAAGQELEVKLTLEPGVMLSETIVEAYKMPLMKKDETSGGQTLSSDQIRNLPAGRSKKIISKSDHTAKIKVSRAEATNYHVDGVRVSGNSHAQPAIASPTPGLGMPVHTDPVASAEGYSEINENPFRNTEKEQISTFSIDVDGASYANTRRFLQQNMLPPRDAVRIEEMINYFDYQYPQPHNEHPFEVVTQLDKCPWAPDHQLLLVALQGRKEDMGQQPASNLVFLVDVSGSMQDENKLPLVKKSLHMLLDQLRPQDRISLVTYAGSTAVILGSTPASQKQAIKTAIDALSAGGGTAGASGIQLAYNEARKNQRNGDNSRVILCTDGDFNVGVSSESDLTQLIEKERESGIYLTVLGFGMGNYQDGKMQTLANKGNGNHAYIDSQKEAQKVLVNELGGTLFTIAKDVKLQLIFNPNLVGSYRLIGYENRLLATEDFDNDKKDAGELGAGHVVTALYELVPPKAVEAPNFLEPIRKPKLSSEPVAFTETDLMTLRLRYKAPKGKSASKLIERKVRLTDMGKTDAAFQTASTVAAFGMMLRQSAHKGNTDWTKLETWAKQVATRPDPNGYRAELLTLVQRAATLQGVSAQKK